MDSEHQPVTPITAPAPDPERRFATEADLMALQARPMQTKDIYIPEFNTWVTVRGMTYGDQCDAEDAATRIVKGKKEVDPHEQQRQTIIRSLVRPAIHPAKAKIVAGWLPATILKLIRTSLRLSGMNVPDDDELDDASRAVLDPDSFSPPRADD